jgi:muramoyltetrapeptide carboxypeptidase
MEKKNWQFLEPGDIIDIIAPSSTIPTTEYAEYYIRIKDTLAKIGLIARIPDDLIVLGRDPFSANSLEYRKNHIIDALTNKTSKAVWCIRGGYGAAKLIPYLDKLKIPETPKLLLGFSDITALHLFLQNKWNWCSMHSAVINQSLNNPIFLKELKPVLFGEESNISYNQLTPMNKAAEASNIINAEITGGNLSLVQTSVLTNWQIQAKDKIIFLEDVSERGYQIDRKLNHLLQAGIFDHAKALIFGEFTPGFEADGSNLCNIAVNNFASSLDIPALSLPLIGHDLNKNSPLPLGTKCTLELGKSPILNCITGGIKTC